MTTIDDTHVLRTLNDMLKAAIAASTDTDVEVKYPGRTQTPPDSQKYIEVVFIPNNINAYRGSEKIFQGVYRIILHWPNDDAGAYGPMDYLAALCGYFTNGKTVAGVQIVGDPNLMQGLEKPTETLYPASLRYSSFRS
jgi:hypothetical protein